MPENSRTQSIKNRITRFDLINFCSFFSLVVAVYYRHREVLFLRYDGTFWLTLAKAQGEWMDLSPLLRMDFLKANGELGFPLLTNLVPGFIVGRIFGADDGFSEVAAASTFAMELFLAVVVLGFSFGLRRPVVYLGAWIACLLTLPLFIPTLTYIRAWGNPCLLTAILLSSISIAIFHRMGRDTGWALIGGSAVIVLLLGFLIIALGFAAPMAAPVVGVVFAVLTVMAEGKSERKIKLYALIAVSALLILIFWQYLYGLYFYTKPGFFWSELFETAVDYRDVSFFLHRHETAGNLGAVVYFFSVAVTLILALFGRGGIRKLACCLLTIVLAIAAVIATIAWTSGMWSGSPAGYVDLFALPLHALVIAIAAHAVITFPARRFAGAPGGTKNRPSPAWYLIAVLPWGALVYSIFNADRLRAHAPWPWPPRQSPIIDHVRKNLEISPGSVFRGRVVNLAGRTGSFNNLFINQHIFDHGVLHATGNDHRQYGFWYYNIPSLQAMNHYTSPLSHFVTTRFLIRPHTNSIRAHLAYETFDQRILQGLGVRYVIDDHVLDDRLLRMSFAIPGLPNRRLYLHELPTPNLANYSPVKPIRISNVKQAVVAMAKPSWDYRIAIVTSRALPGDLVPVSFSNVTLRRGHIHAEARSPGRSTLLLPFEFSHCLTFVADDTDPKTDAPILFRANLIQTGVLFSRSLKGRIAFRFGPFNNRDCRLQDIADARKLGLDDAQNWWPRR